MLAHRSYSLNGEWEIAPGSADAAASAFRSIPVPGLVDLARPPYEWSSATYHWYRKRFEIPAIEGLPHARLVIEQAMFGTAVWLNGSFVGEDIACYTSQDYEITPHLRDGENELLVRIGDRSTLPSHSAVGHDQERKVFIPGIWGDVRVEQSGLPRIRVVQAIPRLDRSSVELRITLHNPTGEEVSVAIHARVAEQRSHKVAGTRETSGIVVPPRSEHTCTIEVPLSKVQYWWPEAPFLYLASVEVQRDGVAVDTVSTRFGMREFHVRDGDFVLNGQKILLRGGNIAFHRFLSDDERGTLPWEQHWIKKVLIDIPKEHNFNFFRAHIGQMYNRWYDIADEHGMLLQNEWQFWTVSGSKDQITQEFTRWIEDNANHPSIVIWDPLNESSDETVQRTIVPAMKALDPTRPWESVDFVEEHPYIYSLGPVLTDRTFGFSRSLQEIEKSERPSMTNEFLWWWIDRDGNPTSLMDGIVERWLGEGWSKEALIAHQGFLATELVELFRRMGVDAIQPFVYLSNNDGPTAHWFWKNLRELHSKPLLSSLKNAFSPVGVSIELWDRHFFPQEKRLHRIFAFNDRRELFSGTLEWGTRDAEGNERIDGSAPLHIRPVATSIEPRGFIVPEKEQPITVFARISGEDRHPIASSSKPGYVVAEHRVSGSPRRIALFSSGEESKCRRFFVRSGFTVDAFDRDLGSASAAIVEEGSLEQLAESGTRRSAQAFVKEGGALILLEPEFGVATSRRTELFDTLVLTIVRREDADRGGYDSAVFPVDAQHPVWTGLRPDHFIFMNGGFGGEMVSQHDIAVNFPTVVHARSGIALKTPALFEIPYGKGRVVVSRIQTRGRLGMSASNALYDRRPDPVAGRYLCNLVTVFSKTGVHDET